MLEAVVTASMVLLFFWFKTLFKARQVMNGEFVLGPEWASIRDEELEPVSIVVPARNEEDNIGKCVRSLLALDYPRFEIVVVDDRSEDRTAEILGELSREDPRVRVIPGQELPLGWCGKTHALHQGVEAADFDWLLMTDADTVHAPWSLKAAMKASNRFGLWALSLYPRLECKSFWERLLQPSVAALIENFVPLSRVNDPSDELAWANGQYMLVKRRALERVGGWKAVKGRILEDVALAVELKRRGVPYRLYLADSLFSTRMYSSLSEIIRGWSKNVFLAMGKRVMAALAVVAFTLTVTWLPVAGIASGLALWLSGNSVGWMLSGSAQYLVVLSIQAYVRSRASMYPKYAVLAPLGAIVVSYIVLLSAYNHKVKRHITWKGRKLQDG